MVKPFWYQASRRYINTFFFPIFLTIMAQRWKRDSSCEAHHVILEKNWNERSGHGRWEGHNRRFASHWRQQCDLYVSGQWTWNESCTNTLGPQSDSRLTPCSKKKMKEAISQRAIPKFLPTKGISNTPWVESSYTGSNGSWYHIPFRTNKGQ